LMCGIMENVRRDAEHRVEGRGSEVGGQGPEVGGQERAAREELRGLIASVRPVALRERMLKAWAKL
jgi:hypothetical protein